MHENKEHSNIRNGILSMLVILSISTSGCAVNPNPSPYTFDSPLTIDPPRGPIMDYDDLNYFQIDCSNKQAQVELLQSNLRTKVEIMKAKFMIPFRPPGPVPTERSNWLVKQLLLDIRNTCYD